MSNLHKKIDHILGLYFHDTPEAQILLIKELQTLIEEV